MLLLVFAGDFFVPPEQQVGARGALFGIYIYQFTYGKMLFLCGIAPCKFTPSCSNYGLAAYRKYGTYRGTYLTVTRLLRCSPFSSAKGEDWP